MNSIVIVAGIVSCGLIAGLFWGWEIAVRPGLGKVSDATFVSTMQSVNVAIVNPIFLTAFVGTGLALSIAALLEARAGHVRRAIWFGASAATYLLGVFGVTIAGNVPLNDQLATFDLDNATPDGITRARRSYEGPWNRLHRIRSVVNVIAFAVAATGATVPTD